MGLAECLLLLARAFSIKTGSYPEFVPRDASRRLAYTLSLPENTRPLSQSEGNCFSEILRMEHTGWCRHGNVFSFFLLLRNKLLQNLLFLPLNPWKPKRYLAWCPSALCPFPWERAILCRCGRRTGKECWGKLFFCCCGGICQEISFASTL